MINGFDWNTFSKVTKPGVKTSFFPSSPLLLLFTSSLSSFPSTSTPILPLLLLFLSLPVPSPLFLHLPFSFFCSSLTDMWSPVGPRSPDTKRLSYVLNKGHRLTVCVKIHGVDSNLCPSTFTRCTIMPVVGVLNEGTPGVV